MGSPIDEIDPIDPVAAKRELRRTMRAVRRGVDDAAGRSERIWVRVRTMPAVRDATVVMVFESIPGEPDTAPFIDWCVASAKNVIVPDAAPTAAFPHDVARIDVVIVPGVAFTVEGDRLGQGGGWYDRLLASVRPDCTSIGVCFAEQIVETIPTEIHDRRLDLIVTDAPTSPVG